MTTDLSRLDRERAFHDERFEDDVEREATGKFYDAVPGAKQDYSAAVGAAATGRVLEYGCGVGSLGFDLASSCDVVGIDISPVAITKATEEAERRGLGAEFLEMNAEALTFEPASFDLVCGSGILHHLDIETAAAQLTKVIKPGGKAIFLEPMGYNPLINWYRDRTPGMRTEDEHPLVQHDFDVLENACQSLQARYHGLAALGSAPILGKPGGLAVNRALTAVDRVVLSVPKLQLLAWIVVVEMTF